MSAFDKPSKKEQAYFKKALGNNEKKSIKKRYDIYILDKFITVNGSYAYCKAIIEKEYFYAKEHAKIIERK